MHFARGKLVNATVYLQSILSSVFPNVADLFLFYFIVIIILQFLKDKNRLTQLFIEVLRAGVDQSNNTFMNGSSQSQDGMARVGRIHFI